MMGPLSMTAGPFGFERLSAKKALRALNALTQSGLKLFIFADRGDMAGDSRPDHFRDELSILTFI